MKKKVSTLHRSMINCPKLKSRLTHFPTFEFLPKIFKNKLKYLPSKRKLFANTLITNTYLISISSNYFPFSEFPFLAALPTS